MQRDLQQELAAAIAAERSAWSAVKDRLPGSPSHDASLWHAWRATVQRCSEARKALDAAAARPAVPDGNRLRHPDRELP